MRRAWRAGRVLHVAALLAAALPRPAAEPPRACRADALCLCRDDHLACSLVPFHRFPDTDASVWHVSVSQARLGALGEAALDARRLRTLVLVASQLHHIEPRALASMANTLASLDLGYNEFTEVPIEALHELKVLNWLNLQNNFISEIDPKMDWGFLVESLSTLSLSNNHLCALSSGALAPLRRLAALELDGNRLHALAPGALPPALALLRLADNLLPRLPCAAARLPRLRHLQLRDNLLRAAANHSCRLERSRIDSLDLSHNELDDYYDFEFLAKLQLKQLILDMNDFTTIPSLPLDNMRLVKLSISHNRIAVVSDAAVHALKRDLERLDLDHNDLATLPSSVRELTRLRYLSVAYNRLEELEDLPPNLYSLSAAGNYLSAFPAGLSGLAPGALTRLELGYNRIASVAPEAFGAWARALAALGLRGNRIAQLPAGALPALPLRELALSFNDLYYVDPAAFADLTELHVLELSSTLFSGEFPLESLLTNLTWLTLDNNNIHRVSSDDIYNFPSLEFLNLDFNKIVEFPSEMNETNSASRLKELRLSYNYISKVNSKFLMNLSELQSIDLSYNRMLNISEHSFASLRNLVYLSLAGNLVEFVADRAFSDLPRLEALDLQQNRLIEFSTEYFENVSSEEKDLAILDLSHNRLGQLSIEQFHNMRCLRHLRLAANELRALPRDCFKNTVLEHLDLSDNRLGLFPGSALAHVGFTLRRLELARNRLEYLDAAMLHATSFLHELGLASNALTVLSDNTFAGLSRLARLDLSHNSIKTNFKELFHNLPRLRKLALAGSGLKVIPHLPLANLTHLDLSVNQIASFRETDVRRLTNLRSLDISFNKLTSLHPSMWTGLPRLSSLDVSHNPLVRVTRGSFEGLDKLMHLRMEHLWHLDAIEPRAFLSLASLRSVAIESPTGGVSIAAVASYVPGLESIVLHVRSSALDEQLHGLRAPKLRALEVRGGALRRVSAHAFASLGRQRALALRLSGTGVTALPAGLVRPLARVPHLALDFSDNRLVAFGPATLYPNLTGWNRFATKLASGGLVVAGNPLRCGCSVSWVGAWLRRWAAEAGGGAAGARAAAVRSECVAAGGRRALLALDADEAECHASALSSDARALAPPAFFWIVLLHSVS
ncbi:chaoptin-like [Ostrinia nubilalis]|uniref:chaoptin-like n=1 Tax=Ostrinia nubilalis TaxID=29057 RepID=UPI0030823046